MVNKINVLLVKCSWAIKVVMVVIKVVMVLCSVAPGAHEPLKEHATECHHNPNYVITFELNWLLSRIYGFKKQDCGFLIWKLVGYKMAYEFGL